MKPLNNLNADYGYASLTEEELHVLEKAESKINNRRSQKIFLIGFSKMSEGKNTGAQA